MNRGARSILATMFLAFVLVGSYYVWTGPDTPPIGERATLEVASPADPKPGPSRTDAAEEVVPLAAVEEMFSAPALEATVVDPPTSRAAGASFGLIEVGPRTAAAAPADEDEDSLAGPGEGDSDASQRVRVEEGDTLSSIARRHLGDGSRWRELYLVNRDLIGPDPNALRVGQLLVLPVAVPR